MTTILYLSIIMEIKLKTLDNFLDMKHFDIESAYPQLLQWEVAIGGNDFGEMKFYNK